MSVAVIVIIALWVFLAGGAAYAYRQTYLCEVAFAEERARYRKWRSDALNRPDMPLHPKVGK